MGGGMANFCSPAEKVAFGLNTGNQKIFRTRVRYLAGGGGGGGGGGLNRRVRGARRTRMPYFLWTALSLLCLSPLVQSLFHTNSDMAFPSPHRPHAQVDDSTPAQSLQADEAVQADNARVVPLAIPRLHLQDVIRDQSWYSADFSCPSSDAVHFHAVCCRNTNARRDPALSRHTLGCVQAYLGE